MRSLAGAVLVVGLMSAGACSKAEGPDPGADRKAAPQFSLKDAEGRTVSLQDFRGKVVLLNFWATWCGPCKLEIPWFVEFEQKYKDRGFAVIGVSMDDEGWEVVKPYIESNRVNYRIVVGDEKTATAYGGVESLPTTLIIDQKGRIVSTHVGLVSKSEYENEIRTLLDGGRADARIVEHAAARGTN